MTAVYLGIDIGTTSTKCLAVDETGGILAQAQHAYPMQHPKQGWAEQDPDDYYRALVDVVRACAERCTRQCTGQCTGHEIAALAMSTQGDTLIVTDESGRPLAPAFSWMDARAEDECRQLLSEAGAEFWYRHMGQHMLPTSSAAKIRWIEHNDQALWSGIGHFCGVADYLAAKLCGRFAFDTPSASWMSFFSPSQRAVSPDVLDVLHIEPNAVSEAVESGGVIGELTSEAAEELGLTPGTRLVSGAFDQAAAAHGAGASAGGRSVLSCGTAWVLYSVSESPAEDPGHKTPICCHVKPSEWGTVLPFPGGSTYDWLNRTVGTQEAPDASSADPLVFIPHLYGEMSPGWNAKSRGSIIGLTLAHTQEDIRLALMRGIACEARRNIEAAEQLAGRVESVTMVGGATKSDIWPQMIANVINRPVQVSAISESACYGAARLAAGALSDNWKTAEPADVINPVPAEVDAEESHYRRFVRCHEALAAVYEQQTQE